MRKRYPFQQMVLGQLDIYLQNNNNNNNNFRPLPHTIYKN